MRNITRNKIQLADTLINHIFDNRTRSAAGAQHRNALSTYINIIVFQHSAKAKVICVIAFGTLFIELNRIYCADSLSLTRNAVQKRHNVQFMRNGNIAARIVGAQLFHALRQVLLRCFQQRIIALDTGIFKKQLVNLRRKAVSQLTAQKSVMLHLFIPFARKHDNCQEPCNRCS